METTKTEEVREDMQWFRWWHDGTTDPKLHRLSFQHRWLWIAILTLASESPRRGSLYASQYMPCNLEDVAVKARLSPSVAKAGIDLMMRPEFGMLELDENGAWRVTAWEKRQFSSDNSTERTRKHRKMKRDETFQERSSNVSGTPPDTETDTDTDNNPLYPPEFDEFWSEYPRKLNKKGALKKWLSTLKIKDDPPTKQQLIDCAKRYKEMCERKGTGVEYIAYASTFLGPQERWRDYLEGMPEPVDESKPKSWRQPREVYAVDEFERKRRQEHGVQ